MSNTIAYYSSPSGSVFGSIGNVIGTNEGIAYQKRYFDSLNIGWGDAFEIPPTPTPTPTPTAIPYSPDSFSCTALEATSSIKCFNGMELQWDIDASTNMICSVSWNTPASVSQPVSIIGFGATSSLTNGETEYFILPSIGIYPGSFNLGIFREKTSLDIARIKVDVFGSGKIKTGRVFGYSTASSDVTLKSFGITGNYIYHTRNCSGNLTSGTGGIISQIISGSYQQQITASLVGVPSIELIEIVNETGTLNLNPRELRECSPPSPTPTATPTATPTQTGPTPTPTPTPTGPTPTPTPTSITTEAVWLNHDNRGRLQASWIDDSSVAQSSGLIYGISYATSSVLNGICITADSLIIQYGTSYRTATCGSPDPRTISYQIDVTTNINGEYNFNYLDPYGVSRNAAGTGLPSTTVYGVACGYSISSITRGSATISSRLC